MSFQSNKLPWFPLDGADFTFRTLGLSNEQKGIYITLLAYSWTYGNLPDDLAAVNSIVHGGDATKVVLARFFTPDGHGNLTEPRLEAMRAESIAKAEAYRGRAANASKAAAEKRKEEAAPNQQGSSTEQEGNVTVPSRFHDGTTEAPSNKDKDIGQGTGTRDSEQGAGTSDKPRASGSLASDREPTPEEKLEATRSALKSLEAREQTTGTQTSVANAKKRIESLEQEIAQRSGAHQMAA